MKITSIDIYLLSIPLRQPLRFETVPFTPNPCCWERLETVLVRVASGDLFGWGEAAPGNGPLWTSEWAAGVFYCLREWIGPAILRREIPNPEDLYALCDHFRGQRVAKGALDMALWDLKSRSLGRPLPECLGVTQQQLPVGKVLDRPGHPTTDSFLGDIAAAFEAGYSRVTVKIRPGWDLPMLNAIRHEFPSQSIHGDFEGALSLNHMDIIYRLDDFNLPMVEQPLSPDDLVGHAMIQEAIRTPICLDESITTPHSADLALELHSAKYLNINPSRVGGLTPAKLIHDAAHEHCVPCYLGMYPMTAVGSRAAYALAGLPNFSYPPDYWGGPELLADDIAEPVTATKDPEDGKLRIGFWKEPGIGTVPRSEELAKWTLAECRLE